MARLLRDIVHVGTPAEVIADGDTKILCMMDLLENYAAQYIQFGHRGIASMDAYSIAFGRVETHSPFLCPCAKCLQITLEDPLVIIGLNLTLCQTVISKQTGCCS